MIFERIVMNQYAYRFQNNWLLAKGSDKVWDLISNFQDDSGWPGVTVRKICDGRQSDGVGREYKSLFRTKLLYKLSFHAVVVSSSPPSRLEMKVSGQLEGRAVWTLSPQMGGTSLTFLWEVNTNARWMALLSPLLRPLFIWNHDQMMKEGQRALSARIGAPVV
ncbi:SRPBCC family protein [Paenibacillus nasutitermitis]|nr:SRPBCC family protein [Paenibacillus nasutitermitis]